MKVQINKNKSIGKVLYIIEGSTTEPNLLHKLFTDIFDYQVEMNVRGKGYHKYNSKINPYSQVFVLNAENSNIKYIAKDNEFLNNLFVELVETYGFDVDNSAIFYLFDRDRQSNTDSALIETLLETLTNSRDNPNYYRQGLLLLSYPAIESFVLSNFTDNSFTFQIDTGKNLKRYLHEHKIDQSKITEETLMHAAKELMNAFSVMGVTDYDLDNFGVTNRAVYDYSEAAYAKEKLYHCLSLLCVSLLDLGLIEVENEIGIDKEV